MDTEARYEFYEFVEQQWGRRRAAQLMDLLPPAGVSELATKADVAVAVANLESVIAGVRTEVQVVRGDLLDKMRSDTRLLLLTIVSLWMTTIGTVIAVAR